MADVNVENGKANIEAVGVLAEQLEIPLLEDAPGKPVKTPGQKAIRKTLKGTSHLANLLPTGSVLAFQILSPVLTHQGNCLSSVSQSMTIGLLGLCAVASFLLCFTDSFRDATGKVRHGVATFRGLWVLDGLATLPPEESAKYRLQFVDFAHGLMSLLVFGAVALFDQNVANCLFPMPSVEAQDLLTSLPVVVGLICSALFVAFPTKRHGIGFPLSKN